MTKHDTPMSLYVETQSSRWVRDGLPLTPEPYLQITALGESEPRNENYAHELKVSRRVGERLLYYWQERFQKPQKPNDPVRSCVDLASFLLTGELLPDKEAHFKVLDEIFRSGQSKQVGPLDAPKPDDIMLLGVMDGPGDCWCGSCCIVHASFVVDESRVLEVKGLGGNLALDELDQDMTYWRQSAFPWSERALQIRTVSLNLQ